MLTGTVMLDPLSPTPILKNHTRHANTRTGKRGEKYMEEDPSPTIPPSAEQEEKRLRPENRAPTDCKLALCAFAQGLTGDKNLDRRDPRVVFLF